MDQERSGSVPRQEEARVRKVYIDFLKQGESATYDTDPRWQATVLSHSGLLVRACRSDNRVRVPLLTKMLDDVLSKAEAADPQADVIIPWKRGATFKKNELLIGLLIRARRRTGWKKLTAGSTTICLGSARCGRSHHNRSLGTDTERREKQ